MEQNPIQAINRVKKQQNPTIFLLDIDAIHNNDVDYNDDSTLEEFSCSYLSCSTVNSTAMMMDNNTEPKLISKLIRDLPNNVPLVG